MRTVPVFHPGLRAVALAAILSGQWACVRSAPVTAPERVPGITASRSTSAVSARAAVTSAADDGATVSKVIVRDYWRAFSASVIGWTDDEEWQGLRAAVLRDGTVAYDHVLFYNAYAVPNLQSFVKPEWFAFSDADKAGKELIYSGMRRDANNCQGKKACTPYLYFSARIPDNVLRNSRDSLVVRVVSYGGYETTISMRGELIKSYLATVDSVSAARKSHTKAGNQ